MSDTMTESTIDTTNPAMDKKSTKAAKKTFGRIVRWQRLAIQIVFLIFAPQTFSLAFAGVKQIFVALGKGEAFEANTFIILLALLLLATIVFGRFFCGYVCAFGTVGDILYKVVHFPLKKLHLKGPHLPEKVENVLRYLKYVVLVFFLVTSFIGLSSTVGRFSPWTAFGRLLALNVTDLNVIGLGLLIVIAIGMMCKERFFCEFLCPLGALYSLMPILPWANRRRHMGTCNGCGACRRACPVHIYPPAEGGQVGECIACGECETVCHADCVAQCSAEALDKRMADMPESGPAESPVKRAQTVKAVVLAIVFFVVFWLLGAVNYLPTLG